MAAACTSVGSRIQPRLPAGLSRGSKCLCSAGGKAAGIHLGQLGWLRNVSGKAAWACWSGRCRKLGTPGWGKEVGLTQPSHVLLLKSPWSGFSTIQRKQREDAPWLAGRLRHTPQRGPGGVCQLGLPQPAVVSLCQCPHSILDSERLPQARPPCRVSGWTKKECINSNL